MTWAYGKNIFIRFLINKPICPLCNEILIQKNKTVICKNSKSDEYLKYKNNVDASLFSPIGEIKLIFNVFYCIKCENEFEINKIRIDDIKRRKKIIIKSNEMKIIKRIKLLFNKWF